MALSYTYPTPLPSTKGWGPGWPNCQRDKMVQHPIFQGGVHEGILDLTNTAVAILRRKGYVFKPGWSWGFGCRATKGGSGDVPSFHSWGLGLDFNAPENPFSRTAADTAKLNNEDKWVVPIMHELGFYWLGPPIGDWMHFSFVGNPLDAKAMTIKAERMLSDMSFDDFKAGWRAHRAGVTKNPDWPQDKEFGWVARDEAVRNPKAEPLPPAPHKHTYPGGTTREN